MRYFKYIFQTLFLQLLCLSSFGQSLSPSYPRWEKGDFDVLMLNTGRGDAALLTMPDGTRMLVDAGELDLTDPRTWSPRNTPPKPDGSRFAYEWIAHYISILTPKGQKPTLDYVLISHFHDDHYGLIYDGSRKSVKGNYYLSGITGVGDSILIRKIVDRGYPLYNKPYDLKYNLLKRADKKEYNTLNNYINFIDYQKEHNDLIAEQFSVGSSSQFMPKQKTDINFTINNVYANGYKAGEPNDGLYADTTGYMASENNVSCAIRIDYGNFRMFMGGDITGIPSYGTPDSYDVEKYIKSLIGKVDVAVANHHAGMDVLNADFIKTLQPRVWLESVWSSDQPNHQTLNRMVSRNLYSGDRDIFATNILEANRIVIGELIDQAYKSTDGHILLRVKESGEYFIYVLDSNRNDLALKATFGPYQTSSSK